MKNYTKKLKQTSFIKSFANSNQQFIYTVLYDIAYIAAVFALLVLIIFIFGKIYSAVTIIQSLMFTLQTSLSQSMALSPALLDQFKHIKSTFIWFIVKSILLIVLALAAFILNSAFFKGLIWAKLKKQKFNKKYFKKFAAINYIWMLMWIVLLVLIVALFKLQAAAYLIVAEFFLFLYFTGILRSIFEPKKKIREMLKKTFLLGTKRCYRFLLAALLIFVVFNIASLIIWGISLLSSTIASVIGFIIIFLFLNWSRFYFIQIKKEV